MNIKIYDNIYKIKTPNKDNLNSIIQISNTFIILLITIIILILII